MKLVRFGDKKNEKPGILNAENERLDISDFFDEWNAALFFENEGLVD